MNLNGGFDGFLSKVQYFEELEPIEIMRSKKVLQRMLVYLRGENRLILMMIGG